MDQTKPRNPIISFLLSIVMPGLGHVYNGCLRKGIRCFVGFCFLMFVLEWSGLTFSLRGLVGAIAAATVCLIFVATHAAVESARIKVAPLKWYSKWYVCSCLVLLNGLGLGLAILNGPHDFLGVRAFKISAVSMIPTLEPGDHFVAKWEGYGDRLPGRGDIVIFPLPEDTSKTFVKRVVALPGEQIQIKNKIVFINQQRLQDPWGIHKSNVTFPSNVNQRDNFGPVDVPEGAVLVLGDNRDFSYDSRFWGHVNIEDIQGKALFIYWSKDRDRIGNQLH